MNAAPTNGRGGSAVSLMASLLVGLAFIPLWFWLLPGWLGLRVETADAERWRWLATIPSVLGFAVALRCIWDFGRTGRGTPAPMAPPQRLVVKGALPVRSESDVRGFRGGLDRTVGSLRTRQSSSDRSSCVGRTGGASLRGLLRGTDAAKEIRRKVRDVLQERKPLVAAVESLGTTVSRRV